jgi:mRNA-degrading endonuclease RelE of RelBE toxin-antitoxin system
MTWNVVVAKSAQKELSRFPAKDQDKLATALVAMASDPFSGDIIKLEGEIDRWRRRAGSYRIFFTADRAAKTVSVNAIMRRTSTTY